MRNEETCNHNQGAALTDLESLTSNEPLAAHEAAALFQSCRIHIHSKRHRLADLDGISHKYAIDTLTECRIIADDQPEIVKEITFSQEKVGSKEPEEVIVTIVEV